MAATVSSLKAELGLDDREHERGLARANKRQEQFARDAERAGNKAATGLMAGFKRINASALDDLGRRLSVGVSLPVAALGGAALKTATDLDSLKRGLTAVAGSSQEADRQLARLKEVAKLPGLGFQEAVQGSINLQAAGLSAQLAERALGGFGNALATVGKGKAELEGVNTALSQIISKGKVSAEEINQIAERVPQIRKLMKDAFGTADTEELQKMGLSSEQFISKIVTQLERLPKATGGAKNSFENLSDTVQQSLAKVGAAILPAAARLAETLAPAVEKAADAFAGLPKPIQEFTLAAGGIAALVGPVISALSSMMLARTALTAAVNRDTAALTANTVAAGVNAKALQVGAGAAATRAGATVAGTAFTGAAGLGAYTSVGSTTAAAAAAPAGFSLGALALPVGIALAGVAGGFGLSALDDHLKGRQQVGFSDTLRELNPFRDRKAEEAASDAERAKALEEFKAQRAAGMSPRQQILAQQAADRLALGDPAKELAKAQDARLEAEIQRAQAQLEGAPEEGRAASEAKALVPILKQQAAALLAKQQATKKDSEDYWKLERERWAIAQDINQLQARAAEEARDLQKKAADGAKQLREMQFAGLLQRAEAAASGAPEDQQARAQLSQVLPLLQARQAELVREARQVRPLLGKNQEATEQYWRASREFWDLAARGEQLKQAATQEQAEVSEKARADAEKARAAMFTAQMEIANAAVNALPEQERSAAQLQLIVPQLRQNQEEILRLMREQTPQMAEYWENVRAYWQVEAQIQEHTSNAQKAIEQQQKEAGEKARKNAEEQQALAGERVQLLQAQLKNNPFLSEEERRQQLLPVLKEQLKSLSQAAPGETERDRLERLQRAEAVKGSILEAAGVKGTFARLIGGGRVPLFNVRRAQGVMAELDQISRAGAAAAPLAPTQANAPVNVNLNLGVAPVNAQAYQQLFQDPAFARAFTEFVTAWMRGRGTVAHPGVTRRG